MLYHFLLGDSTEASGWLAHPEVRILLAGLTALVAVLLIGRWGIRWLRTKQVLETSEKGDSERLDQLHAHKSQTPTLGGVLLFAGVLFSTILWVRLDDPWVHLLIGYVVALAGVGFVDDWHKLRTRKRGMTARRKLLCQLALSALVGVFLLIQPPPVVHAGVSEGGTALFVPLLWDRPIELGAAFVLLVVVVTTGASNAVNLTDGLDGLATGTSVLVALVLSVAGVTVATHASTESMLCVVNGVEIAVFLSALVGGGLGFLWFNAHPADVFMGDTGSLPLGGALGLSAVLLKQELLLALAGGVLVAEALSVVLQVGSYKLRRKRIFLIAPLHHHFQFKGWPETKVTIRFWLVGAVLCWVSLVLLRMS